MSVPKDLSDTALLDELAWLASRAAGAIMQMRSAGVVARAKADASPVTDADEAAEAIILDGLARLLPGVAVISEEAAARGTVPQPADTFVLVDPLDGTREFVAGRTEFTVNIAIVTAGRPIAGIVGAPALDMIWRGTMARGAERLQLPAGAHPKQASAVQPLRTAPWGGGPLRALVSRSHADAATEQWLSRLPAVDRHDCGSSLKFCRIAEGAADVYPRFGPTSEWDIAAGDAVLTAAGGLVLTPQGETLRYGQRARGLTMPAFVAWGDPACAARHASG